MRPAARKAILFTLLIGIVGYLVVDSEDAVRPQHGPLLARGDAEGAGAKANPRASSVQKPGGRYVLPERAALSAPQAQLFGPQSWQPKAPPRAANQAPAAPRLPAMPYRYAGRVLHEGKLKVYLARGDELFPVRKGETLERTYRVESIEDTRITLRYLPLGRLQTIPIESALPLAQAQPAAVPRTQQLAKPATADAGVAGKTARVLWEGPKQVKLGAQFSVRLRVTSQQPVAASPMQVKFDPRLLESVAVAPGRFFDPREDQFSVRVNPEGSIVVGALHRAQTPAADAEFLVLTFRSVKPAAVAELSIAALDLQGPAGRAIEVASPTAFRTSITP
jgi:hypothetical protein